MSVSRHHSDPFSSAQAPKRKPLDDQERDFVKRRTDPSSFLGMILEDKRVVLALDLDQCSFCGEDGCDILNAIGRLTDGFTTKKSLIMDVAKQLVNPNLKPAFENLKKRHLDPLVVVYTAKGSLVQAVSSFFYQAGVKNPAMKMDYANLKFEMEEITSSSFKYLNKQIDAVLPPGIESTENIKTNMDRLGIVTFAIALVLGLPYAPAVFVTNAPKDLKVISKGMGVPVDQIYLLDDKAEEHAGKMGVSLEEAHMIIVPKYNLSTFDDERGRRLQESLKTYFPIETSKFDAGFTRMVTYAGENAPYGMRSIARGPEGLDWDLSNRSEKPITDPSVGYPMSRVPNPEQPPTFREPYGNGRSFSHRPPGSTMGFFPPYMYY